MQIGDRVKIKSGATKWMKDRGFWLESMGDNIDGFAGQIVTDYANLGGENTHFGVNIGFDYEVGIHPQFLEAV